MDQSDGMIKVLRKELLMSHTILFMKHGGVPVKFAALNSETHPGNQMTYDFALIMILL